MDIDFMRKADDAAIIADGGIRNAGDAAKAFAAGARFVMVGGMLAGTSNAPDIRDENNNRIFRGMASSAFTKNVEGVSHIIDDKGDTQDVLATMRNGLASACSYSGVDKLAELAEEAEYKVVTPQGVKENHAHHNRQ
jgi:IMP dehydrogenase